MAQVELLQRLTDEPGLGVSELAARQRLARNTVSNLVQQMVTAGLLERRGRDGDRRAVTLTLTDFGRKRHGQWQHANEDRVQAALGDLAAKDTAAIVAALPALALFAERLEAHAELETNDVHPPSTEED
jgi:DNA-binding MarR family transcriptional regulator